MKIIENFKIFVLFARKQLNEPITANKMQMRNPVINRRVSHRTEAVLTG